METEIFLSRLADKSALYSEVSRKLNFGADNYDELFRNLSALTEPSEVSLYISDEELANPAVDEILSAFEEAASGNENLNAAITVDEFLNIIDSEERITSESKPRSLIHRDGDLHPTVHIWIICRKDMGIYVLLQKRSAEKLIHPECYDVSSAGHVTQGGEYRESAVRELKEELGLDISLQKLEHIGMIRNSTKFNGLIDNELSSVYLYNGDVDADSLTLQKSEVAEVCWAEIDEILSIMNRSEFRHCISSKELNMVKKAVF